MRGKLTFCHFLVAAREAVLVVLVGVLGTELPGGVHIVVLAVFVIHLLYQVEKHSLTDRSDRHNKTASIIQRGSCDGLAQAFEFLSDSSSSSLTEVPRLSP